jgi:hypothetical protein
MTTKKGKIVIFLPRRKGFFSAKMGVKLTGVRENLIGHSPKFIGG